MDRKTHCVIYGLSTTTIAHGKTSCIAGSELAFSGSNQHEKSAAHSRLRTRYHVVYMAKNRKLQRKLEWCTKGGRQHCWRNVRRTHTISALRSLTVIIMQRLTRRVSVIRMANRRRKEWQCTVFERKQSMIVQKAIGHFWSAM